MNVDQVVAFLRELVELRAIKRKIELRTATDDERERYKFSKERAWLTAEGILHDAPLSHVAPLLTEQEIAKLDEHLRGPGTHAGFQHITYCHVCGNNVMFGCMESCAWAKAKAVIAAPPVNVASPMLCPGLKEECLHQPKGCPSACTREGKRTVPLDAQVVELCGDSLRDKPVTMPSFTVGAAPASTAPLPEEIPPGLITATGTILSAYTAKLVWKRWREVLTADAPSAIGERKEST